MRFTVISFQTSNKANTAICSVGISVTDNGEQIESYYALIKPEPFEFANYNTKLTGITSEMCEKAKTFKEVFPKIKEFLTGIVFSHSSIFEKRLLELHAKQNNLQLPSFDLYCSCELTKTLFPELGSYSLPSIADTIDIDYNPNNALEKSEVGAYVVVGMLSSFGIETEENLKEYGYYSFLGNEIQHIKKLPNPRKKDSQHSCFCKTEPTSILSTLSDNIKYVVPLEDSQPTLTNPFFDILDSCSCFKKKEDRPLNFVVTGDFAITPREEVENLVVSNGCILQKRVTSMTDYVIVGENPAKGWNKGSFGRKIEKAIDIRINGGDCKIISEKTAVAIFTSEK